MRVLNTTDYAYIGDAVYEVYVRKMLLEKGIVGGDRLHRASIKYVSAKGQEKIIKSILDFLNDEEKNIVRKSKNRKSISKPKNIKPMTYKWATSFESLIGFLYIEDKIDRLEEIIKLSFDSLEGDIK